MLKLLGSLFVIVSTISFGMYAIMQEKNTLKTLQEIEKGILLLKNRIAYLGLPLAQTMAEIGYQLTGETGLIFQQIAEKMERREGNSASEIWTSVWEAHGDKIHLRLPDLDEVIGFGRTLSFVEREQQEGSLDLLLHYLRERESQIKNRLDKNGKLYYSLGAMSGIMIVVVLL